VAGQAGRYQQTPREEDRHHRDLTRKLLTRAWHLLDQMQSTGAGTPPRRP